MEPRRLVETVRGRTSLYFQLAGEHAGQFFMYPDDDFYDDVTKLDRDAAVELARALLEKWAPDLQIIKSDAL